MHDPEAREDLDALGFVLLALGLDRAHPLTAGSEYLDPTLSFRLTRPEGTIEVNAGETAPTARIDVAVDPAVDLIKQRTNLVCWAAAGTMMRNWKQRASQTVEATLDALGGPWRGRYDSNTGLNAAQVREFAAALGLTEEGAASYTVEGLASLLAQMGPLWAITDDDFGGGNRVVHARIVTAVRGDGTPDGTTVTLADSASGKIETEMFRVFADWLEASEAVLFGTGVFHW